MHQSSDSRFGLRFAGCFVGDLCYVRNVMNFLMINLDSIVLVAARMEGVVHDVCFLQFKAV